MAWDCDRSVMEKMICPYCAAKFSTVLQGLLEQESKSSGLTIQQILGRGQRKDRCEARKRIWRELRKLGWSTTEIGEAFNRDHSTVVSALRKGGK